MAALAHNVLKMVRKLSHGVGTPGPASPAVDTIEDSETNPAEAVWHSSTLPRYILKRTRSTKSLRSLLRRADCRHR